MESNLVGSVRLRALAVLLSLVSQAAGRQPVVAPPGRLAIVADGNSPDPDDIGALAVMLGLLSRTRLQDRLVHLSHSCDLRPTERISVADEQRRQRVLGRVCEEGVRHFGPFENLSRHFNCRREQQAAIDDLRDAIEASSEASPLWIIEAGEPDLIGFALRAAKPASRRNVHVVSHHPANDNSGDFFGWDEVLAFGVAEHQIGDQNRLLQSDPAAWDWAQDHADPALAWVWSRLDYAERDPVVAFQRNRFDCSDAGMISWWITGANRGGEEQATPERIRELLGGGEDP